MRRTLAINWVSATRRLLAATPKVLFARKNRLDQRLDKGGFENKSEAKLTMVVGAKLPAMQLELDRKVGGRQFDCGLAERPQ